MEGAASPKPTIPSLSINSSSTTRKVVVPPPPPGSRPRAIVQRCASSNSKRRKLSFMTEENIKSPPGAIFFRAVESPGHDDVDQLFRDYDYFLDRFAFDERLGFFASQGCGFHFLWSRGCRHDDAIAQLAVHLNGNFQRI